MKLRRSHWSMNIIAAAFLLGACSGQQAAPTTAPSRTPVPPTEAATEAPSPTQLVRATLPPSWTPAISDTPSITPTPTLTLTPSLTYTPSRTFTPTFTPSITNTPTPDLTNEALLVQPLPEFCAGFAADPERNRTSFAFTTAPTISWTAVEPAAAYELRVFDGNRATIANFTTTETEYTLSADLFDVSGLYGWEVSPLDADGVPICPARGSLLRSTP